jgi:NADH-quinone oxidoreductase subunit L
MLDLLWLVPALPLAGFLILALTGGTLPRRFVPWIGAGSVGIAALLAAAIGIELLGLPPEARSFRQALWTWMAVDGFKPKVAFYLDALSLIMTWVVTGVGFLIHVYSAGYMADDSGYSRFFAYMNLFVFAMLILVLADNLALLYLGWEGVGLCSYLLIGFWYEKPENGYAARKAFVVTRVGDTAMAIGLFLLFTQLGTLDIQALMQRATAAWSPGATLATAAALLLLGGAVGKSAQLPLQTWLPDAMAGPTPISALIHAATMVTAGVYLIARTHVLFTLAPDARLLVGVIGAITLLMSGFTALTQTDIKRVLAYSTISQIGYMFLALGAGAWSAAIFHLMTHAFFKALLFLAAGAVILSLHHEQNILNMGGLWKRLPIAFWTFLVGAAALAALPLTSGYYSKHDILLTAYAAGAAGSWLWAAGVIGAFLTAVYTSRLVLIAFFGSPRTDHSHVQEKLSLSMSAPLIVLALLSVIGGLLELPLQPAVPASPEHEPGVLIGLITSLAPFAGILVAILFYVTKTLSLDWILRNPAGFSLYRFFLSGFGMDRLYDTLFVRPYVGLATINQKDAVDKLYQAVVWISRSAHRALVPTQSGKLRWYAASIAFGAALVIAIGLWS